MSGALLREGDTTQINASVTAARETVKPDAQLSAARLAE
jgi:hypothetical protein